jgi:hypothetical protein
MRGASTSAGLAALGALGCGLSAPVAESPAALLDATASDAGASDATDGAPDVQEEPETSTPPLDWTPVSANIIDDITSVWGSSTDVYVGSHMGYVYDITSYGVSSASFASGIVGAGWASDAAHIYAVTAGAWETQAGQASPGLLSQYDDANWSTLATGPFYAIWGSSAWDIYAGGPAGIAHAGDGATFAFEGAAGTNVLGVGGSGANDVYATTSDPTATILHSTGAGDWTPLFGQPTGAAWGVWSSGPGDAYVIVSPAAAGDPDAFVLHSSADGGWTSESVSQPGSKLVTVWGSGPTDVYVGGWHAGGEGLSGDLFHSTGDGRWTRVALPGNIYQVTSVWGRGSTDVYVGAYDVDNGPTLLHGQ